MTICVSRAGLVSALLLMIALQPSAAFRTGGPRGRTAGPRAEARGLQAVETDRVAAARASGVPALDRWIPSRALRVYATLARAFSRNRAMEVVRFMAPLWRLPGNPAFEASQDRIRRDLARAGFREAPRPRPASRVRSASQWFEEFANPTPAWEPVSATISSDEGTELDMARPLDRVSLCINSFSTPPGGVRAPLVVVGRGTTASDYEGIDVRGKIVLGEVDARRLFEAAVRQRGAIGVLSTAAAAYTRPQETPDIVQWSGIPYDESLRAFGFKISPRLANRLKERLAAGPVTLAVEIASRFHRRPNRTLVAEIPGRTRPGDRIVLVAHVQEPGANDNASGCATLLEIARGLATGIARGAIPRPARTITFLWGDEIAASRQWLRASADRAAGVRYAFSLDMTGEDATKTGGSFLIEKQPDPSAVWVRPSDPHTEWGSSAVEADSLKGSLLNDLHLAFCLRRAREAGWVVKANPYEGGSDHSVFLAAGVPALLDWHFTDRYYHTNLDTPDKTSAGEMANVGSAVGATAWLLASSNARDAAAVCALVEQAALARLDLEARQSKIAIDAATDASAAREREQTIFAAWQKWYVEALKSALDLPAAGGTGALRGRVNRAIARVRAKRMLD